jgi:hypothetical protein
LNLVIPWEEITETDHPLFGRKAHALAKSAKAGLPKKMVSPVSRTACGRNGQGSDCRAWIEYGSPSFSSMFPCDSLTVTCRTQADDTDDKETWMLSSYEYSFPHNFDNKGKHPFAAFIPLTSNPFSMHSVATCDRSLLLNSGPENICQSTSIITSFRRMKGGVHGGLYRAMRGADLTGIVSR